MKIEIPTQLSNSIRGGSQSTRNMKNPKENLIKTTCKELGLTYRELGERIGYSESGIKTAISTNKISEPMQKSLEMLSKINLLEKEIQNQKDFKEAFKRFLKEQQQNILF